MCFLGFWRLCVCVVWFLYQAKPELAPFKAHLLVPLWAESVLCHSSHPQQASAQPIRSCRHCPSTHRPVVTVWEKRGLHMLILHYKAHIIDLASQSIPNLRMSVIFLTYCADHMNKQRLWKMYGFWSLPVINQYTGRCWDLWFYFYRPLHFP